MLRRVSRHPAWVPGTRVSTSPVQQAMSEVLHGQAARLVRARSTRAATSPAPSAIVEVPRRRVALPELGQSTQAAINPERWVTEEGRRQAPVPRERAQSTRVVTSQALLVIGEEPGLRATLASINPVLRVIAAAAEPACLLTPSPR